MSKLKHHVLEAIRLSHKEHNIPLQNALESLYVSNFPNSHENMSALEEAKALSVSGNSQALTNKKSNGGITLTLSQFTKKGVIDEGKKNVVISEHGTDDDFKPKRKIGKLPKVTEPTIEDVANSIAEATDGQLKTMFKDSKAIAEFGKATFGKEPAGVDMFESLRSIAREALRSTDDMNMPFPLEPGEEE